MFRFKKSNGLRRGCWTRSPRRQQFTERAPAYHKDENLSRTVHRSLGRGGHHVVALVARYFRSNAESVPVTGDFVQVTHDHRIAEAAAFDCLVYFKQAENPDELTIWRCRTAMLDAIFYEQA